MNASATSYLEKGKIGIYYLKKIWASTQAQKGNPVFAKEEDVEWEYVNGVFNTLGVGIEPTLKYLFTESASFAAFEDWIFVNGHVSDGMITYFNAIIDGKNEDTDDNVPNPNKTPVLNSQDLAHWEREGYVVVKGVISADACAQTRELVYGFLNAREDDPQSWYSDHPAKQGIMIQLFKHELLDQNRLSPIIKGAFRQLWQRSDLLVSMDRVSFNPPQNEHYRFPGPNLHWDVSLKRPIPYGLQGLLYLTDTAVDQGAFTLIPGMHKSIEVWLESLPDGASPRDQDLRTLNPRPIAGQAGDLIIWNQALAHGSAPNFAKSPRIVQYINYQPIDMDVSQEWI